jgi:hypothetical protein
MIDELVHLKDTDLRIPHSEIIIDNNQKPRTYYHIELLSRLTGQCLYRLKKNYKDFKNLQNSLHSTFLGVDDEVYKIIPSLPRKE